MKKPLTIALIAPDCNRRDGQARYVAELAEHFAGFGHEVHVFSVGFDQTDPQRVRHHPIRAPRRATRLRFFAFLPGSWWAVDRTRFDIVHALGASHPSPDVITAQFCQAGWDEVLRREAPRELSGGVLEGSLRRAIAAVEKRVFTHPRVRRLVVVARRVARDVERFYGRSTGVEVLPQGVDLDRFRPRRGAEREAIRTTLGLPGGRFVALFLGEFERKNLRTAILAVSQVPDSRVMLLAVGGSDPSPYRALSAELGVSDRVRFAPRTAEPEAVMAAADAFVFPTLYDPFGTVTLEAAACATPVITSDRPGFAEWLEHGRSGFVVADPLDASQLADHISTLAADPDLGVRVGRAGRRLAESFSWDSVARRTESLYRRILDERAATQSTGRGGSSPPHRAPPAARRSRQTRSRPRTRLYRLANGRIA